MKEEPKINEQPKQQTDKTIPFDALVGLPPRIFTHLDLFSGIGGFAFAAKSIWGKAYKNVGFCEIDKFCHKVLRKNFGNDINIIEDIHNLKGDEFGTVDLITGGFPCQPYSVAGKRKGASDDRALWGEMFRVIKEAKPDWIIGENVTGIINMELDKVLADLEGEDYKTESFIIPACAVNAPHRRDRVWIIAHTESNNKRNARICDKEENLSTGRYYSNLFGDTTGKGLEIAEALQQLQSFQNAKRGYSRSWLQVASEFCGMDDGIPNRVDRLRSLGNAIVPQVAMVLLAALKAVDDQLPKER